MSSFFLRPEHAVGVMKQGGFYRLVKCGDTYQKVWCCDAFSVEKRILKLNAIDDEPETLIVEFIVKFKSLEENHVEFSWDLISLAYLSKGNQLQQVQDCDVHLNQKRLSRLLMQFNAVIWFSRFKRD